MTAHSHRNPSPMDGPHDVVVARGLPAFVEVPAGVAGSEEAPAALATARVAGIADHRAGCSPFPLDAIEID